MSKSCCFAVVLAVICLSVILSSLEADARPSGGKTSSKVRGSSTVDEVFNMVKVVASNQQQHAKEIKSQIRDVKKLSNDVNGVKTMMASGAKEIKSEIKNEVREMKDDMEEVVREIKDEIKDEINKEIKDVKRLLALTPKQQRVSALVSNCVPLLIQQNIDGSNFFNRSWAEFKVGFGEPSDNYWLGNELLSRLTANNGYKLKFDLQSRNTSNWYHAEYSTFRVLTEARNYKLQVAGYSGNAGYDAFGSVYHNGQMFSTYDRDNDLSSSRHCAAEYGGGFWYKYCYRCVVNGARSFYWVGLPGGGYLQSSRMWLQCK